MDIKFVLEEDLLQRKAQLLLIVTKSTFHSALKKKLLWFGRQLFYFGTYALSIAEQFGKEICFVAYSMRDDRYALPAHYLVVDGESTSKSDVGSPVLHISFCL